MKPLEKKLIMTAPVIRSVYTEFDNGKDIDTIAGLFHLDRYKVYRWIRERKQITKKIEVYAPA